MPVAVHGVRRGGHATSGAIGSWPALDWRHHVRVHGVDPAQAPELCDLLERHYRRDRRAGAHRNEPCGPGEPVACTPRDAVETMYSSAIDALVIGRFVLMKDYWLLRNNVD